MAVREGRFSHNHGTLAEGTVRSTVSYVVSTFREHGRGNPTKDSDLQLGWILHRLFRAFKNDDPKLDHQKAIPVNVIAELGKRQTTETERAIAQLAMGAYFFACRSCEYLQVPNAKEKKTRCLALRNLKFYTHGAIIPHSSPLLPAADNIAITFETQKNGRKNNTVTQWATRHSTLCPVFQWASLVQRIRSYPNTDENSDVSTIFHHGRIHHITSKIVTNALRDGVTAIGSGKLRIDPSEVGTHSIRSGSAMAMYLGGVPVFAIQIIGRWSSDAFMRYIRKQIEEFTYDVSARMLTIQQFTHSSNPHTTIDDVNENGGTAARMLG